jgi:hypothetical protein
MTDGVDVCKLRRQNTAAWWRFCMGKKGEMREGCAGFIEEGFAGAVDAWRERGSGGRGRGERGQEVGDDRRDPSIRGREGEWLAGLIRGLLGLVLFSGRPNGCPFSLFFLKSFTFFCFMFCVSFEKGNKFV